MRIMYKKSMKKTRNIIMNVTFDRKLENIITIIINNWEDVKDRVFQNQKW